MTFATLLNGYALNSTIRLTFSEPDTCVGEALATGAEPTRIVFASGSAQSQAFSTGDSKRTAHMNPMVCEAVAVAPLVDAWRVMTVEASGISSGATATGSFTRLAYVQPKQVVGAAESSSFEPLRIARPITTPQVKDQSINGFMLGDSAWRDGRSDSFADATIESQTLATRLISPTTVRMKGTADFVPLAYDLTRWMQPRQARNRAISYVNEGLVFTLRVNQQYARGTAIGRAHSRGTPNTILAFSITYAGASSTLAASSVYIARDAVPKRSVAQAYSSGFTAQDHAVGGRAVATAHSHIAPDITVASNGVRYAYAQGRKTGIASLSKATAVRWPMVRGERQPAWASLSVTQLIARDMYGRAEAVGASVSDPQEAIVTHTVWAKGKASSTAQTSIEYTALRKASGKAEAVCTTTGVPWHWVAVPADGVAQAKAEAQEVNTRVFADGRGTSNAGASLTDTGFKVAYVSGRADAGGATLGEAANVTRQMNPEQIVSTASASVFFPRITVATQLEKITGVSLSQAEYRNAAVHVQGDPIIANATIDLPWVEKAGEVGARRLRIISVTDVGRAHAKAGLGRNVFKINADDPAPDWRVLTVPYTDRSHLIRATSREYNVK